jgi:hypothetical protein
VVDADKAIRDGQRVAQFLADSAVQEAFAKMKARAYNSFKASLTPETRTEAWALARAVDELEIELRAVVDSGTLESSKQRKAERTGRLK